MIEVVRFLSCRILQRFPDGILPSVPVLAKVSGFSQLLGVEEINIAVLQHLHVKGLFLYGNALAELEPVGPELEFLFGLLVEGWRVGQPDENCLRLLRKLHITLPAAKIDLFHKLRHDDRLPCSSRSLKGDHLRNVDIPIIPKSHGGQLTQIAHCYFLEWKQFIFRP